MQYGHCMMIIFRFTDFQINFVHFFRNNKGAVILGSRLLGLNTHGVFYIRHVVKYPHIEHLDRNIFLNLFWILAESEKSRVFCFQSICTIRNLVCSWKDFGVPLNLPWKGKLGGYSMNHVAAVAHLSTSCLFKPVKRPDDKKLLPGLHYSLRPLEH